MIYQGLNILLRSLSVKFPIISKARQKYNWVLMSPNHYLSWKLIGKIVYYTVH